MRIQIRIDDHCDHYLTLDEQDNIVCTLCDEKWVKDDDPIDCVDFLEKPKPRWNDA